MAGYYNDSVKRLYKIISELKSEEECRMLFEDLCTIKEILDHSNVATTQLYTHTPRKNVLDAINILDEY